MNIGQKKDYLNRFGTEYDRLQRMNDHIESFRLNKMYPSMSQDGMPHAHNNDDLSSYAVKLLELEAKRDKQQAVCQNIMKDILLKLSKLDDTREITVLDLRYIYMMGYEEIAEILKVSKRTVLRILDRALKNIVI